MPKNTRNTKKQCEFFIAPPHVANTMNGLSVECIPPSGTERCSKCDRLEVEHGD